MIFEAVGIRVNTNADSFKYHPQIRSNINTYQISNKIFVQHFLYEDLKLHKVGAKFVPKILSDDLRPISQSQKVFNYKDNVCNYKCF